MKTLRYLDDEYIKEILDTLNLEDFFDIPVILSDNKKTYLRIYKISGSRFIKLEIEMPFGYFFNEENQKNIIEQIKSMNDYGVDIKNEIIHSNKIYFECKKDYPNNYIYSIINLLEKI
jgi:hypothetical protein